MKDQRSAMVEDLLARLEDAQKREQVLEEFNASTLDDVAPIGGDKGEIFLRELNEMQDLEGDHLTGER